MDLRKLKTLIDLVSESGISELEITEGEGRVRIVKAAAPQAIPVSAIMPAPIAVAPAVSPVLTVCDHLSKQVERCKKSS